MATLNNPTTDRYHLVSSEIVTARFMESLFGKPINPHDGFSRELFRHGTRIGSIRSTQDARRASNGDTIYSVNMGRITVPLSGTLKTHDDYTRAYDAEVIMRVWYPERFIVAYLQQVDPVEKTLRAINAALERQAALYNHDDISSNFLRYVVENEIEQTVAFTDPMDGHSVSVLPHLGIAIIEAQKVTPNPDPKRVKEIEDAHALALERARLERENAIKLAQQKAAAELERARIANDANLDQLRTEAEARLSEQKRAIQEEYDRKKLAADTEFKAMRIKIEDMQREADRRNVQLDTLSAADTEFAIAQRRLDLKIWTALKEKGVSEARIVEEHPELGYMIQLRGHMTAISSGAQIERIAAPSPTPATGSGASTPQSPIEPRDTSGPLAANAYRSSMQPLPMMGITVEEYLLDEDQVRWGQTSSARAFLVTRVASDWPGNQQFKRLDLLLQINQTPVPEGDELFDIMSGWDAANQPIEVVILRGEERKSFFVTIPPTN